MSPHELTADFGGDVDESLEAEERQRVDDAVRRLVAAFDETVDDETVADYASCLYDFDAAAVAMTVGRLIDTADALPGPAEVRETCKGVELRLVDVGLGLILAGRDGDADNLRADYPGIFRRDDAPRTSAQRLQAARAEYHGALALASHEHVELPTQHGAGADPFRVAPSMADVEDSLAEHRDAEGADAIGFAADVSADSLKWAASAIRAHVAKILDDRITSRRTARLGAAISRPADAPVIVRRVGGAVRATPRGRRPHRRFRAAAKRGDPDPPDPPGTDVEIDPDEERGGMIVSRDPFEPVAADQRRLLLAQWSRLAARSVDGPEHDVMDAVA